MAGTRPYNGPRVYFGRAGRYRLHHGTAGIALVAVGSLLAWHDRRDARFWLPELVGK